MSWIEVECKIAVDNPAEIRRKIKKIAKFVKKEKKVDDYYALEKKKYPKKSLRVRDRGKKREVNFKQRISYKKGVWAKNEVEFEVSDIDRFFSLLEEFGFKKWIRKEKKSELYKTKDKVNIELNHVKKLGWFVEIEVLCDKNKVAWAQKRVLEIRKQLAAPARDFSRKQIRKKGYTKELWEARK